ncbi:MAG: polysaccharide biosynthesis/export family protein [Bacteroidota bacterium]
MINLKFLAKLLIIGLSTFLTLSQVNAHTLTMVSMLPAFQLETILLPSNQLRPIDDLTYGPFNAYNTGIQLNLDFLPQTMSVIAPGDTVFISAEGNDELYESLIVAEDGSVIRPYIGKVFIGGKTYQEASKILTRAYQNQISPDLKIEVKFKKK